MKATKQKLPQGKGLAGKSAPLALRPVAVAGKPAKGKPGRAPSPVVDDEDGSEQ